MPHTTRVEIGVVVAEARFEIGISALTVADLVHTDDHESLPREAVQLLGLVRDAHAEPVIEKDRTAMGVGPTHDANGGARELLSPIVEVYHRSTEGQPVLLSSH